MQGGWHEAEAVLELLDAHCPSAELPPRPGHVLETVVKAWAAMDASKHGSVQEHYYIYIYIHIDLYRYY